MLKGLADSRISLTFAVRTRGVPHRSGYSTLKKSFETVSLANGGPQSILHRRAVMPVDYNSREHSYRVKQEFSPNHRHVPAFLKN